MGSRSHAQLFVKLNELAMVISKFTQSYAKSEKFLTVKIMAALKACRQVDNQINLVKSSKDVYESVCNVLMIVH